MHNISECGSFWSEDDERFNFANNSLDNFRSSADSREYRTVDYCLTIELPTILVGTFKGSGPLFEYVIFFHRIKLRSGRSSRV